MFEERPLPASELRRRRIFDRLASLCAFLVIQGSILVAVWGTAASHVQGEVPLNSETAPWFIPFLIALALVSLGPYLWKKFSNRWRSSGSSSHHEVRKQEGCEVRAAVGQHESDTLSYWDPFTLGLWFLVPALAAFSMQLVGGTLVALVAAFGNGQWTALLSLPVLWAVMVPLTLLTWRAAAHCFLLRLTITARDGRLWIRYVGRWTTGELNLAGDRILAISVESTYRDVGRETSEWKWVGKLTIRYLAEGNRERAITYGPSPLSDDEWKGVAAHIRRGLGWGSITKADAEPDAATDGGGIRGF
jgi:hypothetical protein